MRNHDEQLWAEAQHLRVMHASNVRSGHSFVRTLGLSRVSLDNSPISLVAGTLDQVDASLVQVSWIDWGLSDDKGWKLYSLQYFRVGPVRRWSFSASLSFRKRNHRCYRRCLHQTSDLYTHEATGRIKARGRGKSAADRTNHPCKISSCGDRDVESTQG